MASQLDWYNTLMARPAGRRVFYEIRQKLSLRFRDPETEVSPESALAQCVLDDTLLWMSEQCGIVDEEAEMALIEAEAAICAAQIDKKKEKPEDKDLHEVD